MVSNTSNSSWGATVVRGSARRGKVSGLVWFLPMPPPTSTVKLRSDSPSSTGTTPMSLLWTSMQLSRGKAKPILNFRGR